MKDFYSEREKTMLIAQQEIEIVFCNDDVCQCEEKSQSSKSSKIEFEQNNLCSFDAVANVGSSSHHEDTTCMKDTVTSDTNRIRKSKIIVVLSIFLVGCIASAITFVVLNSKTESDISNAVSILGKA